MWQLRKKERKNIGFLLCILKAQQVKFAWRIFRLRTCLFFAPLPIDKNNILMNPDCKKFTAPLGTGSRFGHSAVRAVCTVRS
jgi:hypothetical protein